MLQRLGLSEYADRHADKLSCDDKRLLDEPNEGLAPVIVQQIGHLVGRLAQTTTILFTEQNLAFALRHAQRAYVLQKGRVVHAGTTAEIRADPGQLDHYLAVA